MQANAVSQRAAWVLVPRPLNCRLSDAVSTHVAPRNDGASVSGANWAPEASEALSSSYRFRHHAWMQANAVSQRAAWVLVPRPLNCRLSDAVSTHVAPRNGGASVSEANWAQEASGTLSSSFTLRHHAWMQANAVSQRSARVLVPRPLNCRLSDAVSTHVAPRNDDASVSAADRVHEASETLSSSLALRHHDQMQADAVSQRAVRVLVPRPLTYHVSDAVSMHVARRNGGAPVSGATGVRAHTALAGFISAGSHRARILARPVVSCMGFAACAAAPWSFDLSCTRWELSCKARRTCTMRTRGACTHGAHRLYFSGQSSCLIFRTGVSISRENFAGNAAGGSVNDCSSAKHAAAKLHARAFLVLGLFAFMQNIASVSANWQGARVLSIAVVGSSSESFATKRESAG